MCLEYLSSKPKRHKNYKLGVGYKKFYGDSQRITYMNYPHAGSSVVVVGKWLTAEATSITTSDYNEVDSSSKPLKRMRKGTKYLPHFHIYLKKPDSGHVRKVYFRKVIDTGYQDKLPVVVATQMYVTKSDK